MAKSDRELQTSCQADQSLADEWSWHGNLYYFGAPGASSQKWYGHGHDNEYPYLYARFTTTQEWARKTGGICVQRHNSLRLIEFWVQSTCTARVHSQLLNHVPRVLHFQRFQTDMSTFSNDSNVCFFSFRFVLFISFHHFSSISLIASIWLETARTWCPWKQSRMSRYLWDGLGQSVVEATLVLQALASMWTNIQMAPGPSCGECGFWTMTVRQAMPKKWEKSIRPVPDVVNSNWSKFGFFGTSLSVIIGHHTLSSCFFLGGSPATGVWRQAKWRTHLWSRAMKSSQPQRSQRWAQWEVARHPAVQQAEHGIDGTVNDTVMILQSTRTRYRRLMTFVK